MVDEYAIRSSVRLIWPSLSRIVKRRIFVVIEHFLFIHLRPFFILYPPSGSIMQHNTLLWSFLYANVQAKYAAHVLLTFLGCQLSHALLLFGHLKKGGGFS